MRIVGVDLDSKKIAIAIFDDSKFTSYFFYHSKIKNTQERIFDLYDEFGVIIKGISPNKVYFEDSLYIQNFKSSKVLSEVLGNCKLVCRLAQIPFGVVSNKTWKKIVIGNGNATKEDIKNFVLAKYNDKFDEDEPQDIFDAIGIGLYGIYKEELEKING